MEGKNEPLKAGGHHFIVDFRLRAGARQKRDETGLGVGWLSGTVLA